MDHIRINSLTICCVLVIMGGLLWLECRATPEGFRTVSSLPQTPTTEYSSVNKEQCDDDNECIRLMDGPVGTLINGAHDISDCLQNEKCAVIAQVAIQRFAHLTSPPLETEPIPELEASLETEPEAGPELEAQLETKTETAEQ